MWCWVNVQGNWVNKESISIFGIDNPVGIWIIILI